MAVAGQRPKPTRLKMLDGNPGKQRLPVNEPKPTVRLPPAPSHLAPAAKAEWRRTGKLLLALGLVTDIDRAAFAVYCQAYARWVEAEDNLRQFGMIVKAPSGYPIPSPFLSIANQSMAQIQRMLGEFGMTPASRTRIQVAERSDADDPLGKLRQSNRRERATDAG